MMISKKGTYPPSSWSGTCRISGLCLIIDQDLAKPRSPDESMRDALRAGVRLFQYRCKHGARRFLYDTASRLSAIARAESALLIINDHADIAVAVDADGVHLGQDDLPLPVARKLLGDRKLIGISTHSVEQAQHAAEQGADYLGFGPVFETMTKDAGPEQGIDMLKSVCEAVALPVLAIGGITHDNVRKTLSTGAAGIAVISAVLAAKDPQAAARQMLAACKTMERT